MRKWWRLLRQRWAKDPYLTMRVKLGRTFSTDGAVMLVGGSQVDDRGDVVLVFLPLRQIVFYPKAGDR